MDLKIFFHAFPWTLLSWTNNDKLIDDAFSNEVLTNFIFINNNPTNGTGSVISEPWTTDFVAIKNCLKTFVTESMAAIKSRWSGVNLVTDWAIEMGRYFVRLFVKNGDFLGK
jgi:hypothetical protein